MNECCLKTLSLWKELYLQYIPTFPHCWLTAGGGRVGVGVGWGILLAEWKQRQEMAEYCRVDHFCRSKWRNLYRIRKPPPRTRTNGESGGSRLQPFDAVCWTLMHAVNPTRSNRVLDAVAIEAFSYTYSAHVLCPYVHGLTYGCPSPAPGFKWCEWVCARSCIGSLWSIWVVEPVRCEVSASAVRNGCH